MRSTTFIFFRIPMLWWLSRLRCSVPKTLLFPPLFIASLTWSPWRSLSRFTQHRTAMSSSSVSEDALFRHIARQQPGSFGRVLDAGTGAHSLRWLLSLGADVEHVTAVTADQSMRKQCQREVERIPGATERCTILCGNWFPPPSPASQHGNNEDTDILSQLSKGAKFDVILADYLIGALDGFSPYQQDVMLPKLLSLLKPSTGRLYIVGLEPIPDQPPALHANDNDVQNQQAAAIVCQVRQVRDACILLAGHRCYREYPLDWVVRNVNASGGGMVRHTKTFPILYRHATILKQINVGRSKLPYMPTTEMREAMQRLLDDLEEESLRRTSQLSTGRIRLGFDYIVTVEAKDSNI